MKPAKLVLLADTLLLLYRQMLRVRRCDERLVKSASEGLVPGEYFSAAGHEAVYVGVGHHLAATDLVFGNHHSPCQAVARAVPLEDVFAEVYGRAAGCVQGRAGPTLLSDPARGMYGSGGTPGNTIVHAVGAAYACRLLHEGRVAVCYFSESAAISGAFHEGLNFAGRHQLPVLFIYEANGYAGRMPADQVIAQGRLALRVKDYDVHSADVDGNDVASVYAAAYEGLRRARESQKPSLLACSIDRPRPHSESDPPPIGARSQAAADPLKILADRLIESEFATSAELRAIDAEVQREVDAAHAAAAASNYAPARDMPGNAMGRSGDA